MSILLTVEGSITGIGPAIYNAYRALTKGSVGDIAESAFEFGGRFTSLSYYTAWAGQKYSFAVAMIADSPLSKLCNNLMIRDFPHSVTPIIAHVAGYAGAVAAAFFFVKESLSLKRRLSFIFNKGATLERIGEEHKKSPLILERTMPEWLYTKMISDAIGDDFELRLKFNSSDPAKNGAARKAGIKLISSMIEKMKPEEKTQLLDQMQSYAIKKAVYHAIAAIGFALSVISAVGLLVGFPPAVGLILLGVIVCLTISKYVVLGGIVENPEGGFSLFRVVPKFMQEWKFSADWKREQRERRAAWPPIVELLREDVSRSDLKKLAALRESRTHFRTA